jgi:signal recognition particle GTPase
MGLNIKSYFVDRIDRARELARRELGEDALLVRARDAEPEARSQGRYEVVFAVNTPESSAADPKRQAPLPRPSSTAEPAVDSDAGSTSKPSSFSHFLLTTNLSKLLVLSPRVYPLFGELVSRGFDYAEACSMVTEIQRRGLTTGSDGQPRVARVLEGEDRESVRNLLREELEGSVSCDDRIGLAEGGRRVIFLVGPAGAGKTNALAKLAFRKGLARGKTVKLLSTDTRKMGGFELLHSFGEALGISCQGCRTTPELAEALQRAQDSDLVLVDTPGYGARDLGEAADLAGLSRDSHEIDTHLVLPATTKLTDLLHAAGCYEMFRPAKLLFTKLDESCAFADLYRAIARLGKPVSFLATGPSVPEDMESATTERIVDLVWGRNTERTAEAA